ncbi:MAG: hypothetical protein SFX74_01710 [Fimbriimonadaceae bacterium]|nr:hypothetical protein [Fimbriimonadaceae bacterium]
MRRHCLGFGLIALSGTALAQPLSGPDQFPQFRNASGLPGGLFGVSADGRPTMLGAMTISTPIGYSLGHNHFALGFANMSKDRTLRFPQSRTNNDNANGTGFGMIGLTSRYGHVTLSGMVLSGIGDTTLNVQYQPNIPRLPKGLGVSFGVQDAFSSGGSAGVRRPEDGRTSRSFFGVATYEAAPGVHLSVGKGDRRFRGLFGSASVNLGKRVKVFVENDTFNTNYGIGWNVGPLKRREDEKYLLTSESDPYRGDVFLTLGIIRQSRAFWGVAVTF